MQKPFIKKSILLLFLAGLLIGFTMIKPEGITDLEKYRLKGKVKLVMETRYSLTGADEGGLKDKILHQKYTSFNEYGYETGNTLFKDGVEYLKSVYFFGADDQPVKMREYHPDGILNLEVTYKYDDKRFRTEASYNWAENRTIGEFCEQTDYYYEIIQNDLFSKVIYKNEYRGFCVEESYLKADSSLSFKFVCRYDFRGNKLESGYYHGNGRLSWMTKYTYDRYDNLIESRVFKSNRIAVISTYKYQFDTFGNWVVQNESRDVTYNILTAGIDSANTVTERSFEYY
jgi:hypothetical protein